ncbi:MAG: NAD(P)/FAD-dependent oxidoreductase [Clostridiales bacterium]|nr:NAD(P)/FAD-dependent oxidoreductase [Clostridiales bacterium]
MYDAAIIGTGPAGVSAAINLKIHNKKIIWFGSARGSKKVDRAELVLNYLGLPEVTGAQLNFAFMHHAERMGLEICDEVVTGVYDLGEKFTLIANDNQYDAKSVIICTGVETAKPIEGELELLGRGVSYCATCDGNLYKGKTIGILCTEKRFEHELEYLCSLAKFAYVMPLYKDFDVQATNVKIVLQKPKRLEGGLRLNKIIFKDGVAEVDGMFILKGSVSPTTLMSGLAVNEQGHIMVNRKQATNISGVFAAGDCTGMPYQYAKAIGEGNVAAHSVIEFLATKA